MPDDDDDSDDQGSWTPFMIMNSEQMQHMMEQRKMHFDAEARAMLNCLESLTEEQFDVIQRTLMTVYNFPDVLLHTLGKMDVVRMQRFNTVESLLEEEDGSNEQSA